MSQGTRRALWWGTTAVLVLAAALVAMPSTRRYIKMERM